jgi:hypothetical protein
MPDEGNRVWQIPSHRLPESQGVLSSTRSASGAFHMPMNATPAYFPTPRLNSQRRASCWCMRYLTAGR